MQLRRKPENETFVGRKAFGVITIQTAVRKLRKWLMFLYLLDSKFVKKGSAAFKGAQVISFASFFFAYVSIDVRNVFVSLSLTLLL